MTIKKLPCLKMAALLFDMDIRTVIFDNELILQTENSLFSPKQVDKGTLFMLETAMEAAQIDSGDTVLDLGCGYGVVGIAIAKVIGAEQVYMVDKSHKATETAAKNAENNAVSGIKTVCGDGLFAVPEVRFTLILSNPPYHTDFSVAKSFIEQGFRSLITGGRMLMVVKRLDWYKNKMTTVFGGVKVFENDGYFVLLAEKRERKPLREEPRTTSKHKKKELRASKNIVSREQNGFTPKIENCSNVKERQR